MNPRASHKSAFTLVEICIVVGLIGLLAAIAIPNFVRARVTSQRNACISNLRRIDDAIQVWAMEYRHSANSTVEFSDIAPYLKRSVVCPAGGSSFDDSYFITTVSESPTCQRQPSEHILPDTVDSEGQSPIARHTKAADLY